MTVDIYNGNEPEDPDEPLDNGYVHVTKYGIEGKVCMDYWSDAVANVICKQSGFTGGVGLMYQVCTK